MINYATSFSSQPRKATLAAYRQLLAENHVDEILGDVKQNGNRERKRELPVWIPQAASFASGKREAKGAVPSGFFFLDIDEKGLTDSLWKKVLRENLIKECRLVYFAESAGGGTHIWAWRTPGLTIEEDVRRLAERLGTSYDPKVKDLSRCCFMVSEAYVRLLDPVVFEELSEAQLAQYAETTTVVSTQVASEVGTGQTPLLYKGLAYEQINECLLQKMGYGEGPVEGERNMALYSLCRYLRFICDFNVERLFQIVPHFGLADQEVRTTIRSAVGSDRPNGMPLLLREVINELQAEDAADEEDDEEAFQPTVPQQLPGLLQTLSDAAPEEFREAVLMSAMPMLGTLGTHLRADYLDGHEHSASFIVSLIAPAATGKSFVGDQMRLLLEPIIQQDDLEWIKQMEYEKARRECGNGEKPSNPEAKIRIIPPTVSNTMLLERMVYAKGEHLFSYAPEIETVLKNNKQGAWAHKSDLFRNAFDNEEYGQMYKSDQSFSGKAPLYYQLMMCGTPDTTRRFFNNVEDGLVTRTVFVLLPDMMGAKMPVFKRLEGEALKRLKLQCSQLMEMEGKLELPRIKAAIADWLEQKRQEYLQTTRPSTDIFRRRAAVNGFRAGMIATALCGMQETQEAVDFAVWFAERTFYYQQLLYGTEVDGLNSHVIAPKTTSPTWYYQQLNEVFTKREFIKMRQDNGDNDVIKTIIYRWKKEGMIREIGKNRWQKILKKRKI